jgi:hypothetical protein
MVLKTRLAALLILGKLGLQPTLGMVQPRGDFAGS